MRERVINKTFLEHQQNIANAQSLLRAKLNKALSFEDVSKAHADYSNARFEDMLNGVENSKKSQNAHLNYQKTLAKHGFSENDFEYKVICTKCNDTGNDNGKACSCIWDKYIKNLKAECEIDTRAKFSFDECNLSVIKNDTQRQNLEKLYSFMMKYASKYPSVKSNTIVLSGSVGTGKTCLASATCRAIVEKGYAVKIMSAYEFNSLMLKAHTSPIAERNDILHDTLKADVLMIDDLGTEPMLKNVTAEYLLLVLEERQNANRTTIITTNLTDLMTRYGERIFSRLHHKQCAKQIVINGNDIRL